MKPTFVNDGWLIPALDPVFHRGDPEGDGSIGVTDAVLVLLFLFLGGPAPVCLEAADFDDDGRIDGSDPISILRWLFLHRSPPALPGPPGLECGRDPPRSAGDLGCGTYPTC